MGELHNPDQLKVILLNKVSSKYFLYAGQLDKKTELFRVHDWRNDVITLGNVPAEVVSEVSEDACDFTWPAQVNKLLIEGDFDLIISIGQVVPPEVVGIQTQV